MVARDQAEKSASRVRLMESAQNGDKEAFRTLFDEIGPLITLFVRRRVFDHAEVDDVCQEALLAKTSQAAAQVYSNSDKATARMTQFAAGLDALRVAQGNFPQVLHTPHNQY